MNQNLLIPRPLFHPLPPTADTDLNLVAEDWSGSGNWTSRDSNAWVATLHGSLTKSISSQFSGRHGIVGWSALNYFSLAANSAHTIHATDKFTYEIVMFNVASPSTRGTFLGGLTTTPNEAGYNFRHWPGGGDEFYVTRDSQDNYFLGGASAGAGAAVVPTMGRAYLITVTIDPATPAMNIFVNGVKYSGGAFPATTTSSTMTAQNCALGIGVDLANGSVSQSFALGSGSSYAQLIRHRAILSDATIKARAAQFNSMKGY